MSKKNRSNKGNSNVKENPAVTPENSNAKENPVAPPTVTKPMSKVAFIDSLYIDAHKAGTKITAKEIFAKVRVAYPNSGTEESTMRTINCRPWHLRQKGLLPPTTRGKKEVTQAAAPAQEAPVEQHTEEAVPAQA